MVILGGTGVDVAVNSGVDVTIKSSTVSHHFFQMGTFVIVGFCLSLVQISLGTVEHLRKDSWYGIIFVAKLQVSRGMRLQRSEETYLTICEKIH